MESYLVNYNLTILTVAPVFIGNGKIFNKKEYLIDKESGTVKFIDVNKMYEGMQRLHKEARFEGYLLGNSRNRELSGFLSDQGIGPETYKKWILREIEIGDSKESSIFENNAININEFIKGPDGRPYIPGSSVKGMLRTIFETEYYLDHPEKAEQALSNIETADYSRDSKALDNADRDLAVDAFHRDFYRDDKGQKKIEDIKNDMLRGLVIGDSQPLAWDNLCLCEKIDLGTEGNRNKPHVMRECLKPRVEFTVPITIDKRIYSRTANDLLESVKKFYANYQSAFIEKFPNPPKVNGNSTTMFLGGGAGYPSKTVMYALTEGYRAHQIISRMISRKAPRAHGHSKDVSYGVSPHMLKCTRYKGKDYQMGACCIVKCSKIEG